MAKLISSHFLTMNVQLTKSLISKFFFLIFLNICLLCTPLTLLGQQKSFGVLRVLKGNYTGDDAVKVDGSFAIDGQTAGFPSLIETSRGAELLLVLSETDQLKFSSDTKMDLDFDGGKITGVLLRGKVIISAAPFTSVRIQTADSVITTSSQTQSNVLMIDFVNDKTRVTTLSGLTSLNKTLITEGQFFIGAGQKVDSTYLKYNSFLFSHLIPPSVLIAESFSTISPKVDPNLGGGVNVGPMR